MPSSGARGNQRGGLPPDRSHVTTEGRNERTAHLHRLSVRACVAAINDEDRTVAHAVARAGDAVAAFIEDAEPRFLRGGRLVYLGAGTSGRLGVLDASEIPPTFQMGAGRVVGLIAGGDRALRVSSEGMEDDPGGARAELEAIGLTDDDSVLGIAAGGTTPYVRGAMAVAKSLAPRCLTGMLVCSPTDAPAGCDRMIVVETGAEALTGSTRMKAGTATKLVLNTISTTLMIRSGRVYGNLMVDVRATNDKLVDRAVRIVRELTGLSRDDAAELLGRAGGVVKVAAVMHAKGVGEQAAAALLAGAGGRLERVIGEPGETNTMQGDG